MTHACRSICSTFYVRKEQKKGRYEAGCKYCVICAAWTRMDVNFCPCCKAQFRTRPRTRRGKERLQQVKPSQGQSQPYKSIRASSVIEEGVKYYRTSKSGEVD